MCMEILAFCGTADRVAAQFLIQLRSIYDTLLEGPTTIINGDTLMENGDHHAVQQESTSAGPAEALHQGDATSGDGYLLSFPMRTTPDQRKLSLHLLGMLCRPYDDPSQEHQTEVALKARWASESTLYEDIRMIEQMDWEFERGKPFRWDSSCFGPASAFLSRDNNMLHTEDGSSGSSESNSATFGSHSPTGSLWLLGSRSPRGWLPTDELKPA